MDLKYFFNEFVEFCADILDCVAGTLQVYFIDFSHENGGSFFNILLPCLFLFLFSHGANPKIR